MKHLPYTSDDFGRSPLMFYYEVTRACDLVCKHCRASAQEQPDPGELDTLSARALIEQIASFPRPPMLVLTGGDPLKRADLMELIGHAAAAGLHVALTPSATPLATFEAFRRAKQAGIRALGISLDGSDAATHDAFRGWPGSFERTLRMMADARTLGLPVQVNTSLTRRNFHQIESLAELLRDQGIAMWSVFFLVPVGRGVEEERILPEEYETAFERLWRESRRQPYSVKTTEAPHYRRWVLEHGGDPLAGPEREKGDKSNLPERPEGCSAQIGLIPFFPPSPPRLHRAPLGVGDGKGVMFVSHTGEIFPAGFLPLTCGRFPQDSVVEVYQRHPTFLALRDPDRFQGNCGVCEYRSTCGGSRARAYAVTGDFLASEPDCVYIPPKARRGPSDEQDLG
jgi:radical SAM protein